jgi:branched-chain amino acid transport system ATP-binding protein
MTALMAETGGETAGAGAVLLATGVTMRFGGLIAVDGVDLNVGEREIVGLIGPNGAGKTTFFNCLTGLHVPTAGQVRYQGVVLPAKPYLVTQAGIARTFQNIRLFANMTVLENVMVGRHTRIKEGLGSAIGRGPRYRAAERDCRDKARELLDFLGIGQYGDSLARNLSYGDQRKLEIARALASDPGLILLDEPTAGMNPQETLATRETVLKIRERGLAVVVIEHDMRFIFGLCDRVAVLVQGRKLVEGTPAQVQADERVIAAYLGTPVGADAAPPRDQAGSDVPSGGADPEPLQASSDEGTAV